MSQKYRSCKLREPVGLSQDNQMGSVAADVYESSTGLKLLFLIFSGWVLLLPFTVINSIYLGVPIDKVMAPVLIMSWGVLMILGKARLSKDKYYMILLAVLFFFVRNISFIDSLAVYKASMWEDAIFLGYFCLPILYIDNLRKIKIASKLIAINATVGCISAFLVALGLLRLPYERFSMSRISLGIDKSIGLISAYGDLAQLSVCFLLLAVFIPVSLMAKKKLLLRVSAFSIVLMGLIGNQSRSFLLSVVTALFATYLFSLRSKKVKDTIIFDTALVFLAFIFLSFVAIFFTDIINLLSGLGGAQAQQTAAGRLLQYQMAFDFIKEYPLLGVTSEVFSGYSEYIHGIHNMWLGQLTRGGIISTMILFGMLVMVYRYSISLLKVNEAKSYAVVIIGYIFSVLVSTLFYPADSSLFWVY